MLVYRHHSSELQGYQCMITDLFHAVPHNPSIAIAFDLEACDCYAKSPFCMDNCSQVNVPLLVHMFQGGSSLKKHSNPTPLLNSPLKCLSVPCHNWNMGLCSAPCVNGHRHGICSECEGGH